MYAYDFGVRSVPPCGDCDDGHCTMNCGPVRGKDMVYLKIGAKPTELGQCLVCREQPAVLEETALSEWRVTCYGCRMKTFDFPKKQDALGAYQTFIRRLK